MTAQIAERLRFQGQDVAMCTEPLGDYFEMGGFQPNFEFNCTALWRGYVGNWEVVENRLYMTALEGVLSDGSKATITTVFPNFPNRVFAHWYSGTLRAPQGKLLKYKHMGYGSTYERDLLVDIERGVVVGNRIRQNGTAESDDAVEGYGIRAMTTFARNKDHPEDAP